MGKVDGEREQSDPSRAELLSRASVRVRNVDTWYTVWGRGSPVVIFLRDPLGWAPSVWLETVAGPGHRLLFPEVPRGAGIEAPPVDRYGRFSRWFVDFLDGLGLDRVEVACETEFEPLVRAARADYPDRLVGSIGWALPPYRR